MDYKVVEFQKQFALIDLELMEKDIEKYDITILVAYMLEIKNGFIVKKQGKTTKKGTKFTYKTCESEDEARMYKLKLHEMLNQYNDKYSTNYCYK